jgi:DNA replication protein DnaC
MSSGCVGSQIKELYSLQCLNEGRPVLLIGQTGVGKTFVAQATGLHACACGKSVLSSTEAQDLCEILEERSIGKSAVFITQLPLDHWSEVIADPIIADVIRDRLEHAALTIQITGESCRRVKACKLASRKKDA